MRVLLILLIIVPVLGQAQPDYKNYMGPNSCAECHEVEGKIWQNTHHYKSYKTLSKKESARAMAKKLNVKRIKADPKCATCHFSLMEKGSKKKLRPVSAVSCESCHGAAKPWVKIHDDYGGKNITRAHESKAHKLARIKKSEAKGFMRPARRYAFYKQCYECHMVFDQKLINSTKHPEASDFELVAWSNGEIRHKVFYNDAVDNKADSRNLQRIKYVLGQALQLETSLAALTSTEADSKYQQMVLAKYNSAKDQLIKIAAANPNAKLEPITDIIATIDLETIDAEALTAINEQLPSMVKTWDETISAKDLAAVDKVLPKPADFQGTAKW